MTLKGLVEEDFINYKCASMYLIFPKCDFKCDKENGCKLCQNSKLVKEPNIEIDVDEISCRYIINNITHAIVCGGLEPFDTWNDLLALVTEMRLYTVDPIIIYTGYTENEIKEKIEVLKDFENIIIKFGRFIPNKEPHMDRLLGVKLASPNQYAKKIS